MNNVLAFSSTFFIRNDFISLFYFNLLSLFFFKTKKSFIEINNNKMKID